MAIEIKLEKEKNDVFFTFDNAYLKVLDVEIRASTSSVYIKTVIFANQEARNTLNNEMNNWASSIKKDVEKINLDDFSKYIKTFSKNGLIEAAYNFLKETNKYQGKDV